MVSVSSILTVTSMSKVKFQHKAIVTITNVTMYAVASTLGALLIGAVVLSVYQAMNGGHLPQFLHKLDHDLFTI